MPAAHKPKEVVIPDDSMTVSGDVELLSDVILAMLEGERVDAAPTLEVDRIEISGRPYARVVVERRAWVPDERTSTGLWDLAGGLRLETALRLSAQRAPSSSPTAVMFSPRAKRPIECVSAFTYRWSRRT